MNVHCQQNLNSENTTLYRLTSVKNKYIYIQSSSILCTPQLKALCMYKNIYEYTIYTYVYTYMQYVEMQIQTHLVQVTFIDIHDKAQRFYSNIVVEP